MKTQELLKEIEFEEAPEKAIAQLVVDVSNIETYDHTNRFYPTLPLKEVRE